MNPCCVMSLLILKPMNASTQLLDDPQVRQGSHEKSDMDCESMVFAFHEVSSID